jgi:hypothetical protein
MEHDTHTAWTSLHWSALKVVRRLKTSAKSPDAEAPGKSIQRDVLPLARPPRAKETDAREAVKKDRLA